MTRRKRFGLIAALAVAVITLVGTVGYAASTGRSPGPASAGTMMGAGMGQVWLSGNGQAVTSIAAARARAGEAAARAGLHPGEVIWFDNGFYVELKDGNGDPATEVIVDPAYGSVTTEPGPAMMWNTAYGMHRGFFGAGGAILSEDRAHAIAQDWLDADQPGATVMSIDRYPGYYTVDVGRGGTITGMLSVSAGSGQVWFHTWHGAFIAREDA